MLCRGICSSCAARNSAIVLLQQTNLPKSRTNFLVKKNVQDNIASKERRFISGGEKPLKTPLKTVIVCMIRAGTGVWSRIEGHAKRGGRQYRRRRRRFVPVAITNDYMSSKTCRYCFNTILHSNKRNLVRGYSKIVANNFASIYYISTRSVHSTKAGKNC